MNIAAALKSEISRVARKEVRAEVSVLKKSSSKYRSDIARLKRQITQLERLVAQLSKGTRKKVAGSSSEEATTVSRYSAKNLASLRKKLGLSAADFGLVLGVSGASIYLWEQRRTRPRARNMLVISMVRAMSKARVMEHLASLK